MAKKSRMMDKVGVWSYVVGLLIAIIVGLFATDLGGWATWLLVILGIIVGILNIGDEEVVAFLVATIAFIVGATALNGALSSFGWTVVARFLDAIVMFTAPGAIIVAFKALYHVAKNK